MATETDVHGTNMVLSATSAVTFTSETLASFDASDFII